jgi:PAS domain S-box-containing protein
VLIISLVLTAAAVYFVSKATETKAVLQFQNIADDTRDGIQSRLDTYIALLRSGSALFATSNQLSSEQFHAYVDGLELPAHYPGSLGIGFALRVKPRETDALVASLRQQGMEGYHIWPEGERAEYFPITYLEPLDPPNKAVVGYDMFSEAVRRAAMERARDTGLPAASDVVTLVQKIDEQRPIGFLIYVPVYKNGKLPASVAERRQSLRGFVYSPFRASDVFSRVSLSDNNRGVNLRIFDGTEFTQPHLLYQSPGIDPNPNADPPRFTAAKNVDVAGRTWSLVCSTTPAFESSVSRRGPESVVVIGGVLISLLLYGITEGQAKARVTAELSTSELQRSESAVRFQARLLDTVEEAAIATDVQGKVTYWNQFAEKLYGWPAGEASGRNIIELVVAEEERMRTAEIMSRLVAGERWSGEVNLRRRDGSIFPALVTGSPIYDDAGVRVGVVGVSSDLTDRKRAEDALRAADQRALVEYAKLLERITSLAQALGRARDLGTIFQALRNFSAISVPCSGLFISLYDARRRIRVARYGWGDEGEMDVSDLPPMSIDNEGPNSRAVKTGQVIITDDYMTATESFPGVVVGPDDGRRPQSSLVAPMAVMGRVVGTIEVQSYKAKAYGEEHITAIRMAANLAAVAIENVLLFERESTARAGAEESNRMKDEFLATVSHELRTPLTAILGWSRILTSENLDSATSARAIEIIKRNAKVQAQIIDDILDVSRIIRGKLRLELQPVVLTEVIEAAINAVRPAAEAKDIGIETIFDPGLYVILGDSGRLQQILWNLLSNAVKFTPSGGHVCVRLRQDAAHLTIVVSDTGQGISADFLPYVFDRFRQADSTTTRSHGGLGLGLAIVRHLVELHGGTVEAKSGGEGQGATMTVELPVGGAAAKERAAEGAPLAAGSAGGDNRRADPLSLEGFHVLVVDDEADTLSMLKTILEEREASVIAVGSAAEALKAIEVARPDVLVSDIAMPDIDGYEFIQSVRRLEGDSVVPIPALALTAYAGGRDRARAISAGFQEHLAKPVEPSELLKVIARLANTARGGGQDRGKGDNGAGGN